MDGVNDITALIAELERDEKPILRAAVDALVSLARSSAEITAALQQRLGEPQLKNRWAVAYVLAQLPQPSFDVAERLLENLDHDDADIRWAVGLMLVRLADRDEKIAAALLSLGATGTPLQRRMAVYCARYLNLQEAASARFFFDALRDFDPRVRIAAATSLGKKKATDLHGKETLLELFLNDPDSRVRCVAAVALAQIGAPSEKFLFALELAVRSGDEQLKRAANAALSWLESTRAAPSGS